MGLAKILVASMGRNASDIILTVGRPPMFRINGALMPDLGEPLSAEDVQKLVFSVLSETQIEEFNRDNELDLAVYFEDSGRFRVNVFRQQNNVGAAFRPILSKIPTFESLGLPPAIGKFCTMPSGLICVTGPTGSGKSTTLAAMINHINMNRQCHIVTIEDPIEFVHPHLRSVVEQREVGKDTSSYTNALKYVLRQCPDVILIGEMRDLETIAAAITIAETGHLVFATLHTQSAAKTIDRIIDVFPPYQQQQIRAQLATTLKGVVSQVLLPKRDSTGRVAAREIMVVTPGISNLIREGKVFQIPTALQTGSAVGMVSMDQSLTNLRNSGIISDEIFQARVTPRVGGVGGAGGSGFTA